MHGHHVPWIQKYGDCCLSIRLLVCRLLGLKIDLSGGAEDHNYCAFTYLDTEVLVLEPTPAFMVPTAEIICVARPGTPYKVEVEV